MIHRRLLCLIAAFALAIPATNTLAQNADPEARAIAEAVMERMGGQEAWDNTRYLAWNFFGGRQHYWDKWTGDVRIEIPEDENRAGERTPASLILMNLDSRLGRAWVDGVEVTDPERLEEMIERGWRTWVNDAYWMFMPYKLLDPGVNLRYVGEEIMADDREADVLELTFEGVGVTPQNRYLVYVAKDSGLVEQWSYFANREDAEPGFTMPWAGWRRFGEIMIATDHGRGADWDIQVYEQVPEGLFSDPAITLE